MRILNGWQGKGQAGEDEMLNFGWEGGYFNQSHVLWLQKRYPQISK